MQTTNHTLLLHDLNPAVVQAWQAVFADCSHVDAAFGNILETPADAIISPANLQVSAFI